MPKTKKQIIVDYCREHGIQVAGRAEVRQISEEIRRALGSQEKISLTYIAQVLQRAGMALQHEDRYLSPPMAEPYASRLKGALQFRDLNSAEASLRRFDDAYQTYARGSDRVGISLVRSLLLKGKQRALKIAANPRVDPFKRKEKQEIAHWFTIWLQTPDLFFSWLELRKRSEEFQRIFDNKRPPDDSRS
jgi:hypothetical protein